MAGDSKKQGIEGVDFYIDDRYYCESCGSHSHRCDMQYGCCYECGADDWAPEKGKESEIYC